MEGFRTGLKTLTELAGEQPEVVLVRRIGEPVQVDHEALALLTVARLLPGERVRARRRRPGGGRRGRALRTPPRCRCRTTWPSTSSARTLPEPFVTYPRHLLTPPVLPASLPAPRHAAPAVRRMPVLQGALKLTAALVGLAGLSVPVLAGPAAADDRVGLRPAYGTSSFRWYAPSAATMTPPAVSAPAAVAPAAAMFGVLGFTAVARPEPRQPTAADLIAGRPSGQGVASRSTPRVSGIGTAGLTADARVVLASITWAFPQIASVIGVRPDSIPDHPSGHAIDFMVPSPFSGSGVALGNEIVAAVQANASAWHVKYLIYRQRIWLPGSGWRGMSDRGSPTANHMDHVHVTVS